MGEGKPRQDVTFLALAVAVLAIAVALFVMMRSMPKRDAGAPAEETQEEVVEEPEEGPAETPEGGRDPFRSQGGAAGPAAASQPGEELRLGGIVSDKGTATAVIYRGSRRHHVKAGDRVGAYRVLSITQRRVMLAGNGEEITLVYREPEGEE
jgi:type II secretory pathway component PulC